VGRVKYPATYQDLIDLPEHLVGEILDGELIASPRPAARNALASSVLGSDLGGPFHRGKGGPGGWWILDEPELHLGQDVMVPDLSGWRRERLLTIPDDPYFTLAPDWVCEVLSPSTAGLDLGRKLPKYFAASIGHAWVIDPRNRTLQVYRRGPDGWILVPVAGDEQRVRAEPFDAIELDLTAMWPPEEG
jgi:Uma2 family endonuclease